MHVYKFRILLEDIDDFTRDYELKSNQSFEDLHNFFMSNLGFDGSQLASFYICDAKWKKNREISLIDMAMEDSDEGNPLLMSNCKLKDFIEDPHQRIIYVYDFLKMWTFYIELIKILPEQTNTEYPRCTKSHGEIPRKSQQAILNATIENEDDLPEDNQIIGLDTEEKFGDEDEEYYNQLSGDNEPLNDEFNEAEDIRY